MPKFSGSNGLYRVVLLGSLVIILPVGYWVRFSEGWAPAWVNDGLGSVAYELFWIFLVAFLFPNLLPVTVAIAVCLATCAIEFLQLWQPPFLQAMRGTLPGRLVLGNTFSWTDFPAYFVGSWLSWWGLKTLRQRYLNQRILKQ